LLLVGSGVVILS